MPRGGTAKDAGRSRGSEKLLEERESVVASAGSFIIRAISLLIK